MSLGVTIVNGGLGASDAAVWKIEGLLQQFANLDFRPLMEGWEKVLEADNRRGLLQGQDGEGKPLDAVTYRPKAVKSVDLSILPHNNLTSSHYRSLSGPPLIPRGQNSRAIVNFVTSNGRGDDGSWFALGAWKDVLDVDGRPFLDAHFEGKGHLPKRDLRGVRPQGLAEASEGLRRFLKGFFDAFPAAGPPPTF